MTLPNSTSPAPRRRHAYLRAPAPLHFPVEEAAPETQQHFLQRTALFQSLRRAFPERGLITSDQFLYWDPTDPKQKLAPDLAVRLAAPRSLIEIWKTWEWGAPELAVEIVSEHDRPERETALKLERYRRAGVREVVRFDPEHRERPLRIFDLYDGDLVERDLLTPDALGCDALGLYWATRNDAENGLVLRLARDVSGSELLLTPEEAELAALARVRELEAELARPRGA